MNINQTKANKYKRCPFTLRGWNSWFDLKSNNWKLLGSCSKLEKELVTITENEFKEVSNDTFTENDGFVAPNYVITLAPKTTIEDMDGNNFIKARKRPFHDTDQV